MTGAPSIPQVSRAPSASTRRWEHPAPVRVAYCVARLDVGGTELNALRTAQRLDRGRFDVRMITLATGGALMERFVGARIPLEHFPLSSLYDASALRQGLRLYRHLRRERIDVLHCHDMYSNVFAVPWARLAQVPLVMASRRWIHAVDDQRLELANRAVYRFAHRVIGNSTAVIRHLQERDRVAGARIIHMPNFVDESAFEPLPADASRLLRTELGLAADAEVIGCIARLVPVKDHATLLRAVAVLAPQRPRLHLVLVGDGPCRELLVRLAGELGIAGRTHFAGTRPNVPNLNRLFDVSVLSSTSEGFPNSLVEAMAAGRPVVATDVGGNGDAVRSSTGILVPSGNAEALAVAIGALLSDTSLRARLGRAAERVAREEYHVESVLARLESSYIELLGRRRSS